LEDITNPDNYWTDDPTAVDVHWGIEKAYDYFLDKHNRDSYDNNGSPVAAWVHFGDDSNIAAWNSICSCMIFGDGDGENFSSLTSLDIVGHEYAHGVTRHSPIPTRANIGMTDNLTTVVFIPIVAYTITGFICSPTAEMGSMIMEIITMSKALV